MTDAAPTIQFAGRTWTVKVSSVPVGPGPNLFAASNVVVDASGLRLSVRPSAAGWTCAEVIAQGEFGYGSYRWTVSSTMPQLDPNVVLGMFTWSDDPEQANRELDIEFSGWGRPDEVRRGAYSVHQPAHSVTHRFATAPGRSEHRLSWTPGRVAFSSHFGPLVQLWSHESAAVPTPGGGVAPRINLWLFQTASPAAAQSVAIESFTYTPPRAGAVG